MKRFKSILLYANRTSSSVAALRWAEALASQNETRLHVVDVLPDEEVTRLAVSGSSKPLRAAVTSRLQELGALVAPAWRRGVAVQVEVLIGTPFVEIIRAAARHAHDLVVLNLGAEEGAPRQPLGTTALHLLRECPCPVWVIKRDECGRHGRVLAAVDADEDWCGQQRESLRVLDLAASIAESNRSELRVVYCLGHWTSYVSPVQHPLGRHRRRLDELLARCDLGRVRHDVHVEERALVEIIAELCEEVDVLVMGTVWRSWPIGVTADTATEALARVDCSLLAVKPEGFITPVRLRGRSANPGGWRKRVA